MAIKDIIGSGIGFAPGGVKFIVTRGFSIGEAAAVVLPRVTVAQKFAKPAVKVTKVGK